MISSSLGGGGFNGATTQQERKKGNMSTTTGIRCDEVSTAMPKDSMCALSGEDMKYIKNLIAEGIARALVEKVAKNTVPAVDGLEPERYNPSTKKGGTLL